MVSGTYFLLLLLAGLFGVSSVAAQQVSWQWDFFDVAVGAPDTVWLYGGGDVLRTTDGGRGWTRLRSASSVGADDNSPMQIQLLDAHTGWVLFDGSLLHRTTDGGRTWQVVEVKPPRPNTPYVTFLKRFQMVSPQVGFGLNSEGDLLLRTTDGGVTWRANPIQSGRVFFVELTFLDGKRGWVSGNRPGLAATDNGGQTWQALPPGPSKGGYRLQFRSTEIGWLLEFNTFRLYRTLDGGQGWQACGAVPNNAEINGFFFLTTSLGWAASDNGVVLRSTDGCASWQVIHAPISKHLRAVHFIDARNGWAAGNEDGVVKTTDGGLTWTQVQVNVP